MSNRQSDIPSTLREFYNHNTAPFLRFGRHSNTQSIHQPIFTPSTKNLREALNFSNQLVLDHALDLQKKNLRIADLGCGVGGSIIYLAEKGKKDVLYFGLSISGIQIQRARRLATQSEEGHRCTFYEADFQKMQNYVHDIDLAFSIEAFSHSPNTSQFIQQLKSILKNDGKFIIIDDFLTPKALEKSPKKSAKRKIEEFRKGWILPGLISFHEFKSLAIDSGFEIEETKLLTSFMKLGRPRDRFISFFLSVFGKLPPIANSAYFQALNGGKAKQWCIKRGLVEYRYVRIRRK